MVPKTNRIDPLGEPATGTRAAIFEAAYDEFAEKGRSGASMRAIARRAGCTQSLVHHHFGSKDDLWEAASRDIAKLWFDLSSDFLDDPEPDAAAVREILQTLWSFWQANPRALRMGTWLLLEGALDEQRETHERGHARILSAFGRAQRTGAIRSDIPVDVMVLAVYSAVTQACLATMKGSSFQIGFESSTDEIIDGLFRLLRPQEQQVEQQVEQQST